MGDTVSTSSLLVRRGMTRDQVRAQLDGRRWRRVGHAIVLHNGPPTPVERLDIALVNAGPRSVLTAFTALEVEGLRGWHRDPLHLLVPVGTKVRVVPGIEVVVHRTTDWDAVSTAPGRPRVHACSAAAVRGAGSLSRTRSAVGLLAACVQQGLVRVDDLRAHVEAVPNLRHRAPLLAALGDIAMGAQALSEIDFAVLCRRAGLAEPDRQTVRVEPSGRRRYLDAEWVLPSGRRVVAEVDGALHLRAETWVDDQFRHNEVAIGHSTVLRFPSIAVRAGDARVADQLLRAGVPRRPRRGRSGPPTPVESHRIVDR